MSDDIRAIVLTQTDDKKTQAELRTISADDLPEGDVTVRVAYSTMNYKDGLAITGKMPVVRTWPMVPGIDIAGVVESSTNPEFKPGDRVVLNGWGVGEVHWGGLAEKARLKGEWLIPLPEAFTPRQAMAIGTAGYTAMLCVMALERNGVKPDSGPVLVTGANGGVGSVAVALLSKLGYSVTAATGRHSEAEFLKKLGATEVVDRETVIGKGKALEKERWAGAIDVVGGSMLAGVCAGMRYGGTVAACGMAGGMAFAATVAPFILRGVTLAGVDSVMAPRALRIEAWNRLARDLDPALLESLVEEIPLEQVIPTATKLLDGQVRGRVVVPVNPEA